MHYLIDGYNLLFRTLRAKASDDLKNQREKLVLQLGNKLKVAGINASVVFDSYYQIGPRERLFQAGLDIHYTDEKQTADDYILEWLRHVNRPQDYIVVTSDRSLARRSASKGARVQDALAFKTDLDRIYRKKLRTPLLEKPLPNLIKVSTSKSETLEERYERIFEAKLEEEPPKKGRKPKKLLKKETKSPEEQDANDYERWLRLFGSN